MTSNRGIQWREFYNLVMSHIEEYTVPQYGDMPDDQASLFTIDSVGICPQSELKISIISW